MSGNKDLPWFPFFVNDWITDGRVRTMNPLFRGFYVDLLCYQWREGSIPDDSELCRRLIGADWHLWYDVKVMFGDSVIELGNAWDHLEGFFPRYRKGQRRNAKLAKIYAEQSKKNREAKRQRSAAGRRSGKARAKRATPKPQNPKGDTGERSFNDRSTSVGAAVERGGTDPDPDIETESEPGLLGAKKRESGPKRRSGKQQGGSPNGEPLDIPQGVKWSKVSNQVEMTPEFRRWLGEHLRELSRRENLNAGLTTSEAQQSLGVLNGHLIGAPYKTNKNTLPKIVVNWFENDLRRKANRTKVTGEGKRDRSRNVIREMFKGGSSS